MEGCFWAPVGGLLPTLLLNFDGSSVGVVDGLSAGSRLVATTAAAAACSRVGRLRVGICERRSKTYTSGRIYRDRLVFHCHFPTTPLLYFCLK